MYNLNEIANKWKPLAPFLTVPRKEAEYNHLLAFLDRLVDEVGNNEGHPLAALMDTVGTLIEVYEKEHHPFSEGNPVDALKYLMEKQNVESSDLAELGSPRKIAEILSGKRNLDIRQIQLLSQYFDVSAATFL